MDIDSRLTQIQRIAQNSRASWFALLALLVFVGVTLMSHDDSHFFAFDAVTQLPLINIAVPAPSFFIAAPVIIGAFYIYLHIYLIGLWYALAKAPTHISDEPHGRTCIPGFTLHLCIGGSSVGYDATKKKPVEGRGAATVAITALMTWLFGPSILAILWLRSMSYHEGWITLWISIWFYLSIVSGFMSFFHLIFSMRTGRIWPGQLLLRRRKFISFSIILLFASIAVGLGVISWKKTGGGHLWYSVADLKGTCRYKNPLQDRDETWISPVSANLRGAALSQKPKGWLPYEVWLEDWNERFRKRRQNQSA